MMKRKLSEKAKVAIITAIISALTIIIPSIVAIIPQIKNNVAEEYIQQIDPLNKKIQEQNKKIERLIKSNQDLYTISGQLRGAGDKPVENVQLYAIKQENVTTPDDQGNYRFANMLLKPYTFVIVSQSNKKTYRLLIGPQELNKKGEFEGITLNYNFTKE